MEKKALYLMAEFDEKTQEQLHNYYVALEQAGLIEQQTKNISYHFTLGSYDVIKERQLVDEMDMTANIFSRQQKIFFDMTNQD